MQTKKNVFFIIQLAGNVSIWRLASLAFTAFAWSSRRIPIMQTASISVPGQFGADAATILFDFIQSKQKPRSNPFDSGRGEISCRRRLRYWTLWCMFQLFRRTWREWRCVLIRAKVCFQLSIPLKLLTFHLILKIAQKCSLFEWFFSPRKQRIKFPFARRSNKAYYFDWSWHGNRTISGILAALGIFKRTRRECTSKSWHSHVI